MNHLIYEVMKKEEKKLVPYMFTDIRVFNAIRKEMRKDNSFTGRGFFGQSPKYAQKEVRDIWFQAMGIGIEKGLMMGSLEGQRIDMSSGCKNERHKEFYRKFLDLAKEYNCAIQHSSKEGLCLVDLSINHNESEDGK